jgi:hypothetical protein
MEDEEEEEEEEEEEIQPFWCVFQELKKLTVSRTTLNMQLFLHLSVQYTAFH